MKPILQVRRPKPAVLAKLGYPQHAGSQKRCFPPPEEKAHRGPMIDILAERLCQTPRYAIWQELL